MARHHNNEYADGATVGPSKSRSLLQHVLRVFQFLSATTSLILFSIRIAKIIRLAGRASRSNGAVEGILAAAVAYTLLSMCMRLLIRGSGSNILRLLFVIMDLLFVAAFIVVAVLTSPKRHGSSAPCSKSSRINRHIPGAANCNLPWGTFILAIISTLLHAITAAFNGIKDHRREKRNNNLATKEMHHNQANVNGDAHVDRSNMRGNGMNV